MLAIRAEEELLGRHPPPLNTQARPGEKPDRARLNNKGGGCPTSVRARSHAPLEWVANEPLAKMLDDRQLLSKLSK
jgi:hypothetical protein